MKQKGFTIVELLIVIVVIGILASITVVAYGGLSQRARNTSRLSSVSQAQKLVQIALASNTATEIRSTLNFSNNWYRACVGTGYKDINADGKGDCGYFNNSPYVSESTAFNNLLKSVASVPSMTGYPAAKATDGDVVAGPYLGSAWVDSTDMLVLEYSLEGEQQKCSAGPLVYSPGSNPTLTPSSTPNYTTTGDGLTGCIVVMADHL